MNMEYRTLGRTGFAVSAVGLGCEGFMGKTGTQVRADFDFAADWGVNFLDCYSSNPELRSAFGEALRGQREKWFVQAHFCTAWENGQYLRTRDIAKTRAGFEDALRRMDTDYIDVGMIHYVDAADDLHKVLSGPVMEYAQELKRSGRIRSLGMSSHNPQVALEAAQTGLIDVFLFSINPCYDLQPASENVEDLWADENYAHALHNIDADRAFFYEYCERENIGIDVMKVYGGGDLLSDANSPFGRAFTPVQCIEYALSRPGVASVMVGCKTQRELGAALEWCSATREQKDYIPVMQGMERFSWQGHCMYCGHCAPCPKGISVASVNKFLNLTKAQGIVPETIRDHYSLLPHHAGECIACGSCENRCPFGVPVVERMKEAARVFGR